MLYVEKIIEHIYNFFHKYLITKNNSESKFKPPINSGIRELISHIFESDTMDTIIVSDDGSTRSLKILERNVLSINKHKPNLLQTLK